MDEEILEAFETYVAQPDALIGIKVAADCGGGGGGGGVDYTTLDLWHGQELLQAKSAIRMAALPALQLQRIRSSRLPPDDQDDLEPSRAHVFKMMKKDGSGQTGYEP